MKHLFYLALLLICNVVCSQRYLTDEFDKIDSIIGGIYGTAKNHQSISQNLLFDFYEPANDPIIKRPLIIYIHGGGFTSGSRSYPSVRSIARRMSHKGYAVANIDYRLDPDFNLYNSSNNRRAMTDAMHDAKQAIRYFKANANTYKIDTSFVFIGGESAGAITAMMASYVDKQEEMLAYPMANPNNPMGSTTNSEMSNKVKATLCLCGMIIDTLAMELATDPPILWTHGSHDNFIPIGLAFNVVLRAAHIGLPVKAKAYQGATHCPWYYGNPGWAAYLDSTITDIATFLYPIVTPTGNHNENINTENISIYPNPFTNAIFINGITYKEEDVTIFDMLGQNFTSLIQFSDKHLDTSALPSGIYVLLIGSYRNIIIKL